MNIGFISTRLAGNDGVSLEAAKWAKVFSRMGHKFYYCAGLLDQSVQGQYVPQMHFEFAENTWIDRHAFGTDEPHPQLFSKIEQLRKIIYQEINKFLLKYSIDLIIPQNIFAIPMHIPLALALSDIIRETSIATIAHHHDFCWERERYQLNCVAEIIEQVFPPDLPSIRHVVINSLAQKELQNKKGIDSTIIANVFDFSTPTPNIDNFNKDFRRYFAIDEKETIILAPVRIIRRKGLEMAVDFAANFPARCKLIFTHKEDIDQEYWQEIQEHAQKLNVSLLMIGENIGIRNAEPKCYSLWDAYLHADYVAYPSIYEGFGNALLEAIYFKKPALINRYSVYCADIAPLGFRFVELEGSITPEAIGQTWEILKNDHLRREVVEHNYSLAAQHYSLESLEKILCEVLTAE